MSQNNYEGKMIADIQYEGLLQSDELSVKSVISTKRRSDFSMKKLDEDIKALYNLELFENISVRATETEEGIVLTFIFVELPTIREINIKGNKKVKDRTIKDNIVLKVDSVFRETQALSDVQNIIDLYEDKGFPDTMVNYETKGVTKKDKKTGETYNSVDLTFNVEERRKLIIKTLSFSGVTVIREEKLRRIMKTKERGYLFNSGFFREGEFELDKGRIEELYDEKGYIDARVIKIDREITLDEKRRRQEMDLTLYIDEGDLYTFGGAVISGNKIFTNEELYSQITLENNDVFNKIQWETDVQNIRNLLAENGYIYFDMNIDESKDEENDRVSFTIYVAENNKAHVENIFITGNEKTKDFVIAREIEIREGEIFNSRKIQRSREKLFNLQYFAAVNIDVKPGSEIGLVDLIFDVEEQRTGLFSFGLTYSTAGSGISFFEEVSANNFLGRGMRLYEKVQIGFVQQIVEVGLDEPWLFNTPTSAGVTVSWTRTEYGTQSGDAVYSFDPDNPNVLPDDTEIPDGVTWVENPDGSFTLDYSDAPTLEYVNTNYALALRLGRRFLRYYGVNGEISFSVFRNFSDSELVPFDEGLREQFEEGYPWFWKNYLRLTGYRDTRDNFVFATRGHRIAQDIYFYGGFLGGYSNFLRLNTDMNVNVKTFNKFVLSSRLNFGFILPWLGKPLRIDDSDLLRIDTWNEGRGWQHPSQFGSLYALRGRSELNFSLEYRYPIDERLLWILAFFDASGLFEEPSDFTINPKDLYYSFGFGAALSIPGFPIRLYLTRRFKYDKTREKLQFANSQSLFRNWDFVLAIAGFF
jgi:outer membrane protein insertion porin family